MELRLRRLAVEWRASSRPRPERISWQDRRWQSGLEDSLLFLKWASKSDLKGRSSRAVKRRPQAALAAEGIRQTMKGRFFETKCTLAPTANRVLIATRAGVADASCFSDPSLRSG